MADSVAEKSGFLCMYMSNHPDTLVAYAKWFGEVKEPITGAQMTAIDSKSMSLTCTLRNGEKKNVRVPIDPPLLGYEEVKPRLLEMKAFAQEGLGMIKAPQISQFFFPKDAYVSGIPIFILYYLWLLRGTAIPLVSGPANAIVPYTGTSIIDIPAQFILVLHALESFYTFSLCYRHSTGFFVGSLYIAATMFSGFPIWRTLRQKIQAARIDSVMKIQ